MSWSRHNKGESLQGYSSSGYKLPNRAGGGKYVGKKDEGCGSGLSFNMRKSRLASALKS